MPPDERAHISLALHSKPEEASHLEYVRTHTGFSRRIVVTPEGCGAPFNKTFTTSNHDFTDNTDKKKFLLRKREH